MPRQEVEKSLIFVGFLVFDIDWKADSKSVVREPSSHHDHWRQRLHSYHRRGSYHRLGMIKSATDKKEESSSVIIFLQDLLNSEVVWRPLGKEVKTSAEMEGA